MITVPAFTAVMTTMSVWRKTLGLLQPSLLAFIARVMIMEHPKGLTVPTGRLASRLQHRPQTRPARPERRLSVSITGDYCRFVVLVYTVRLSGMSPARVEWVPKLLPEEQREDAILVLQRGQRFPVQALDKDSLTPSGTLPSSTEAQTRRYLWSEHGYVRLSHPPHTPNGW